MPPVEFEPAISAGERLKTYVLDRAATGTGFIGGVLSFNYELTFKANALYSFLYLLINYSALAYCV